MDTNKIRKTTILPNKAIRKTLTKFISIILIEIHLLTVTFNGVTYEDIAYKFDLSSFVQELFSIVDDFLVKKCFADYDPPQSVTFQAASLQNFQADLFTGAAKYSLPILIPQGRAGIQPNLSLNYFSSQGNSWCGVGWNLVVPSISRSTKWGIPKYNTSDTFIFTSGESQIELVNIGGNEYRTKIEGEFVKFIFDGATWQMIDKAGKRYFFGWSDTSRQTNPFGTFKWCLDKVIDSQGPSLNGNYMLISYFKDQGQIYPEQIRYTGNEDKGDAPHQTIDFIREARTDIPPSFITGYSVVTAYRLKEIDIKVDGNRLRKYVLNYVYSSKTNRSLLNSFIQYGSDGVLSLPQTTFSYQENNYSITSGTNWLSGPATYWSVTGDFNGDALTDSSVYIHQGNLQVGLSNGSAFNSLQTWLSFSHEWGGNYGFGWAPHVGDFNGDGLTDVLGLATWLYRPYQSPPEQWVFHSRIEVALSNGTNFYSLSIWRQEEEVPFYGFGRILSLVDFNGDGLTDLGEWYGSTQKNLRVYFSNGSQFVEQGYWINNLSYTATTQIFGGDFNGDGLSDIGKYNEGAWDIALGTGSGLSLFTNWLSGFGGGINKVATVIDINNDGLSDAVLFDKDTGNWQFAISDGTRFIIQGDWITNYGANKVILAGDFDGDGIVGPGYFDRDTGNWQISDTQGTPYDLLTEINNGLGGSVNISYAPSPHNTSLPFTVQTVSSVTTQDGFGNSYATTYQYQNGLYDAGDREFRGFGYVKSSDAEGNYTETTFLQDDIFKGRIQEQRSFDAQGNPYNKTADTWQSQEIYPGVNFAYLARVDTFTYDGNATGKRTQSQNIYDTYGNNIQAIELGEVDLNTGEDIGQDKRTTFTEYTYNIPNWLLKFPKRTYVQDQDGVTVKQSWFYYDNHQNLDAPPIRGDLTKQENWLDGATNPFVTFSYDDYGNIITSTNANNQTTTTSYDSTCHLFPVLTVNALGHQTNTQYYGVEGVLWDDGQGLHGLWGQAKSTTDPNGVTGYTTYDVFGRVEKDISALDSIDFPTVSYIYDLSSNPVKIITHAREISDEPGTFDSVSFYDGLGRLIQTKTESEEAGRFIVSGQTEYNSRGLPEKKYLPKFTNSPIGTMDEIIHDDSHATIYYDAIGRVVRTVNPDTTESKIQYDRWTTTTIDANSHVQQSIFDAYGRLKEKKEYTGVYPDQALYATTSYSYDILGNLTSTTDTLGNSTTLTYDTLGRKITMQDPDMGNWSYAYDGVGNLIYQTDAKAQIIEFSYDALNRLTTKHFSQNPEQDVTYIYDDPEVPNSKGRLTKANYTQSGDTKFFYDALGREIKSEKKIDSTTYTVERTYDAAGRLTSVTYPDSEVVNYTYNNAGQIEQVNSISNADFNTKLLLHNNGQDGSNNFIDNSAFNHSITANGGVQIDTAEFKFGGASGLFSDHNGNDAYAKLLLHSDGPDGSQSFTDSSPSGHPISANGQAQLDTAQFKFAPSSGLFDGNGDYLSAPDSDDWNFGSEDFTIDFWVRFNAFPAANTQVVICSQWIDANNYWVLSFANNNDVNFYWTMYAVVNSGSYTVNMSANQEAAANYSLNTWYHIAFVRQGLTNTYWFKNGTDLGGYSASQSFVNLPANLQIGRCEQIGDNLFFNGWLDELRISKGVARWTENFTPPASPYLAPGYLSVPDSEDWNFGSENFTIECWVKFNSLPADGSNMNLVSRWVDESHYFAFGVIHTGGVPPGNYFLFLYDPQAYAAGSSAMELAVDTWYHFAIARYGDHALYWKDGVLIGDVAITPGVSFNNYAGNLRIGSSGQGGGSAYFDGHMDEVRISKGIARWTENFTPPSEEYSTGVQNYVSNVDYSASGQITRIEYGNGVVTEHTYDPNTLRLTQLQTTNNQQQILQNLTYTYEFAGNISRIDDAVNSVHSQTFAYDEINRLTSAIGVYGNKDYQYSQIGNIISKDNLTFNYGDNAGPHAVTSLSDGTTFGYDSNGNMISEIRNQGQEAKSYEYDFENRLKVVKKNNKLLAQFHYDGDGGRTKKVIYPECGGGAFLNKPLENRRYVFEFRSSFLESTENRVSSIEDLASNNTGKNLRLAQLVSQNLYAFSPREALHEIALAFKETFTVKEAEARSLYDIAPGIGGGGGPAPKITIYVGILFEKQFSGLHLDSTTKHLFLGSQRIASITNGNINYIHSNHLGSSNIITDNNGLEVQHLEYEPYGSVVVNEGQNTTDYRFTGKELDETGLYFFGARYYNPVIGRFITPDIYIQDFSNPQTFNRYSYCGNNPVNYIDPSGNGFWGFILWLVGLIATVSTVVSIVATIVGMITQQQTFFRIAQISGYIGMAAGIASFVGNSIKAAIAAKGAQLAAADVTLDTIVVTRAAAEAYRNAVTAQAATQAAGAAAGAVSASAASTATSSALMSGINWNPTDAVAGKYVDWATDLGAAFIPAYQNTNFFSGVGHAILADFGIPTEANALNILSGPYGNLYGYSGGAHTETSALMMGKITARNTYLFGPPLLSADPSYIVRSGASANVFKYQSPSDPLSMINVEISGSSERGIFIGLTVRLGGHNGVNYVTKSGVSHSEWIGIKPE